jgi:Zn finger protein HypA/HybF involved in hydrogenase expression
MITTAFQFTLPKGLVDAEGMVHRQGVMRLSTAKDELILQKDQRVQASAAYSVLVRLSQVITELGQLSNITPEILENLFILDLVYLKEFYNRINQHLDPSVAVQCPQCNHSFSTPLALGES